MEINFPIMWGVNLPSNGGCYNRNVGLTLDTDLVLLVVDAGVSECRVAQTAICHEMRNFSDRCRKWSAKLLRPALDMEREVTQTRVRWDASCSDSHRMWAYSGLRLKSPCFLEREIRVLSVLVQNATFVLK